MGQFGGYYKGDKKKQKRKDLDRKAEAFSRRQSFVLPTVEIIKKGKNEKE